MSNRQVELDKSARLNQAIAQRTGYSRRAADDLIRSGLVRVNNCVVQNMACRVQPQDRIHIKNRLVAQPPMLQYYMLHKSRRSISTTYDPQGRPTVMKAFAKLTRTPLFPVGRLDAEAEGLLLVTNDGHFAQRVLHPRYKVTKTYMVKLNGVAKAVQLRKLMQGVSTRVGRVKALQIRRIYNKDGGVKSSATRAWYKVVVVDGKNRELHHMFNKIGFQVLKIQRVAIGGLKLGRLKKGAVKALSPRDLKRVFDDA